MLSFLNFIFSFVFSVTVKYVTDNTDKSRMGEQAGVGVFSMLWQLPSAVALK